ncbi:hypothetical protein SDC9_07918 [bioreactor metagenome]|uniref:Peptidase C39-like domain-containing protein n=1 Tax=bioreactor metagenome TaxID=1076179 RepID=A0A644T5U6_9ZZZZ|nr:papain-like cysteine protease family protein [Candidatus Elulimicrobiales bacterium]
MKTFFCSQHTNIKDEEWKNKGCSVSALWMTLKSLKTNFSLSLDELLNEAINIKAFSDSGFWRHDRIAVLAHNHGLAAYAEEFKSIPFGEETEYAESLAEYGIEKIFNFLKEEKGLVIVSVPKDFSEENKPHSILLTSAKEEGGRFFVYNDSDKKTEEEGQSLEISLEIFKKNWRRLAIFINKI